MNKEEIKIKEFDKEQLEILLNDLQDIDKFTGFKDGAFKYELGKYQANLLISCIKKYKEVIDKLQDKFNFYKNTDWGLKSCEILKVFEDILKEV